jgi:hypothetical protein
MRIALQTFFNFCANNVPLLRALMEQRGEVSEADVQGRASQRLVDWLSNLTAPGFSLVHLPDYDPIGLAEFERLYACLGERVSLYLPPKLDVLFTRYSNRKLLQKAKTRTIMGRLRGSRLADVQRVLKLIDSHNAGLEQEALLS